MEECLFPKTHLEEHGGKNRAETCPRPGKDWSRLRETKKQTTRAKANQVDGQATAKDARSIRPRIGQPAKRIGRQAPIQSDRYRSSMGRETLARPSLHLRWRKRCCAKDLVRGASSGEARFCTSRVLVLSSKCWRCLFGLSPCHPSLAPHQRSHSRVSARHQGTNGARHHSTVCRRCRARYRYHCICADVPPWWWWRLRLHLKGDGSWILSNHARSTASSASPPGPPVQGYFRIPGLALWALLGLARLLLPLGTMNGWKRAHI